MEKSAEENLKLEGGYYISNAGFWVHNGPEVLKASYSLLQGFRGFKRDL